MRSTPLASIDLITPLVYVLASSYRLDLNHDDITAKLCSLLSYHFQDAHLTRSFLRLFENSDFVAVWSKIVSFQNNTPFLGIVAYINGGRKGTFPLRHANSLMMRFTVSQESCLQLITSFPSDAEKESVLLYLSHNHSVLESLELLPKTEVSLHLLSSLKYQFSLYPADTLPFPVKTSQMLSLPPKNTTWCLSVLSEVCIQSGLSLEKETGLLKNVKRSLATLVNSFANDEKGLKLHSLANELGITLCLPAVSAQVTFIIAETLNCKMPTHFREIMNLDTCPPLPKNDDLYQLGWENSISATLCKPGRVTRILLQDCLLLSMRLLVNLIQHYDAPSDLTIHFLKLHLVPIFASLISYTEHPALLRSCLTGLEKLVSVYRSFGFFLILQFILDSVTMDLSLVEVSSIVVRHILIHKDYPLTRDSICAVLVVRFCEFDNGSAVFADLKKLVKGIEPAFVIKDVQMVSYNLALDKGDEPPARPSYALSSMGYPPRHRNASRAPSVHVDDFERLSLM